MYAVVGRRRGQAAPAEYSPGVLLNARGDIIRGGVGGVPERYARPAAGLFLGSDGTDMLGRFPPAYLLGGDFGGAGVSNNTSETSLLTGAITNGWPAMVAAHDTVDIFAAVHLLNTGGNQTLTLNLYSGATQVLSWSTGSLGSNANGRHVHLHARCIFKTSGGAGAGVIRVSGGLTLYGPGASGGAIQAIITAPTQGVGFQDATVATNAAANMDLKAALLNNTATTSAVLSIFQARYYPKNY